MRNEDRLSRTITSPTGISSLDLKKIHSKSLSDKENLGNGFVYVVQRAANTKTFLAPRSMLLATFTFLFEI